MQQKPRKLTARQIEKLDREIAECEAIIASPGPFQSLAVQAKRELADLLERKAQGLPAPKPVSAMAALFGADMPRELALAPESSDVIVPLWIAVDAQTDEELAVAEQLLRRMVLD